MLPPSTVVTSAVVFQRQRLARKACAVLGSHLAAEQVAGSCIRSPVSRRALARSAIMAF